MYQKDQNLRRPNGQFFPNGTYLDMGTKQRTPGIGNPYMNPHSIPVQVKRFFTDVNGTIIAKGAAPAAMQTDFPYYIFGDYDRAGGYSTGLKALAPRPNTYYLMSFVNGYSFIPQNITGFSGVNNVKEYINVGDIVHVYTDDLQNPNCFVWIVLKNKYASLASIIDNSDTLQMDGLYGKINVKSFKYNSDNYDQINWPYFFIRNTNFGAYEANQVNPLMFRDPFVQQDVLVEVTTQFGLDQYMSIGQYFLFATEEITYTFQCTK